MESKTFIRGAYYLATELLTRAYHQGMLIAQDSGRVKRLHEISKCQLLSLYPSGSMDLL
jgi:hypothetical protein